MNKNYTEIFSDRAKLYNKLKDNPKLIQAFKLHYKNNPVDFINQWGITFDPRKKGGDSPKLMPFVLYPRQEELINWFDYLQEIEKNGTVDKSRDGGATWLACAYSWHQFLFKSGTAIGFGSRKQDLVDRIGDPKTIFTKIRQLFQYTPAFFLPKGFNSQKHLTFMRCINEENGSSIIGEAGDNIGRGGRTSMYFKDESAFYEHPESIEAALGENTNVQVDISTHNGTNTIFYEGVNNYPADRVFVLDWKDHPNKDREWYDSKRREYDLKGLLHLFAQEIDRDPSAAVAMVVIPKIWIDASIDAHIKLNIDITGEKVTGFDVKEEGKDEHSNTIRNGNIAIYCKSWGNGDSDDATKQTLLNMDNHKCNKMIYDSVGIGSGAKNTAKIINSERKVKYEIIPYNGASEVIDKYNIYIDEILNKDMFLNAKAQSWWNVRDMFKATYNAVVKKEKIQDISKIISISKEMDNYQALCRELSQPTYSKNSLGKIIVDKKPNGAKSPNRADSFVMCYTKIKQNTFTNNSAGYY